MAVLMAAWAVMMVRVAVDDVRLRRGDAAVDCGAVGDLDLNRRVVDAEVIAELMVDALQNRFALSERHLDDLHVAAESVRLRGQAPDVQVMHVDDAGHTLHRRADLIEVERSRCAFEQNVQRLAHDAPGAP